MIAPIYLWLIHAWLICTDQLKYSAMVIGRYGIPLYNKGLRYTVYKMYNLLVLFHFTEQHTSPMKHEIPSIILQKAFDIHILLFITTSLFEHCDITSSFYIMVYKTQLHSLFLMGDYNSLGILFLPMFISLPEINMVLTIIIFKQSQIFIGH